MYHNWQFQYWNQQLTIIGDFPKGISLFRLYYGLYVVGHMPVGYVEHGVSINKVQIYSYIWYNLNIINLIQIKQESGSNKLIKFKNRKQIELILQTHRHPPTTSMKKSQIKNQRSTVSVPNSLANWQVPSPEDHHPQHPSSYESNYQFFIQRINNANSCTNNSKQQNPSYYVSTKNDNRVEKKSQDGSTRYHHQRYKSLGNSRIGSNKSGLSSHHEYAQGNNQTKQHQPSPYLLKMNSDSNSNTKPNTNNSRQPNNGASPKHSLKLANTNNHYLNFIPGGSTYNTVSPNVNCLSKQSCKTGKYESLKQSQVSTANQVHISDTWNSYTSSNIRTNNYVSTNANMKKHSQTKQEQPYLKVYRKEVEGKLSILKSQVDEQSIIIMSLKQKISQLAYQIQQKQRTIHQLTIHGSLSSNTRSTIDNFKSTGGGACMQQQLKSMQTKIGNLEIGVHSINTVSNNHEKTQNIINQKIDKIIKYVSDVQMCSIKEQVKKLLTKIQDIQQTFKQNLQIGRQLSQIKNLSQGVYENSSKIRYTLQYLYMNGTNNLYANNTNSKNDDIARMQQTGQFINQASRRKQLTCANANSQNNNKSDHVGNYSRNRHRINRQEGRHRPSIDQLEQLNDSCSYFFHPSELSNIQKITQLFINRNGQPIQCYIDGLNRVKYKDTNTFMFSKKGDIVQLTQPQKRYYLDKGFIAHFGSN